MKLKAGNTAEAARDHDVRETSEELDQAPRQETQWRHTARTPGVEPPRSKAGRWTSENSIGSAEGGPQDERANVTWKFPVKCRGELVLPWSPGGIPRVLSPERTFTVSLPDS